MTVRAVRESEGQAERPEKMHEPSERNGAESQVGSGQSVGRTGAGEKLGQRGGDLSIGSIIWPRLSRETSTERGCEADGWC